MLPPVVQGVVEGIGRKAEITVVAGAASELEKRYRQEILGECNQILADRYPFTPNSSNDLPLCDFSRLFNYGGVFDKFFNENLDPLVDRSQSPVGVACRRAAGDAGDPRSVRKGAADSRPVFPAWFDSALELKFHVDGRGGRLVVHSIPPRNRRPGHRVSAARAHRRRHLARSEFRGRRRRRGSSATAVSRRLVVLRTMGLVPAARRGA